MKVKDTEMPGDTRASAIVGIAVIVAFVIGMVLALPGLRGASVSDGDALSEDQIAALGYDDATAELLAGVWDSSYGPTVVIVDEQAILAPGSSDGDVSLTADHSGIDVDARSERTSAASDRADAIAREVPLTSAGTVAVTQLITDQRAVEEAATALSDGADIVAVTVQATSAEAHATGTDGADWVQVTLYVTEEYRDGIISEGEEIAIVAFDSETHQITDAALLTQEDLGH